MIPNRIAFSGKIGSGKTTLAKYIGNKYGHQHVSFAKPLKDVVKYLYDFNDEQLYGSLKETIDPRYNVTPRYLLQYIGTELFRTWDHDYWIKIFEYKNSNIECFVLDDIRFNNECDLFHKMGGIVIKVVRHNNSNTNKHLSEMGIKNYDYKIYNDGSYEDLFNSLHELFEYIERNKCNNNKDNETNN
jgi:hypothetical protein